MIRPSQMASNVDLSCDVTVMGYNTSNDIFLTAFAAPPMQLVPPPQMTFFQIPNYPVYSYEKRLTQDTYDK